MSEISLPCAMLKQNPTESYWLRHLDFPQQNTFKANIAIIGAGISGASICYHLSKLNPSRRVVLLDARGIAGGATGRNGGLLWPSMPDRWSTLVSKYGVETTKQMLQFSMDNVVKIKEFVDGIPSNAEHHPRLTQFPNGAVHLMETQEEFEMWKKEIEEMKRAGGCLDIGVWDKDTLKKRLQTRDEYVGAIHDREAYSVRPADLVYHLVKEASKLFNGNLSFMKKRVQKVEKVSSGFKVITEHGNVMANQVVYCLNAYTNDLVPEANITPIRNQVIITKPLEIPFDFAITCNSGYEYLSPREDKRIVFGGMRYLAPNMDVNNPDDDSLDQTVSLSLHGYLKERFLGLVGVELESEWAGIMGWTPDRLPLVGEIPNRPKEYICAGFSGHGMPRAYLCALQVAKLIENKQLDATFPAQFLMNSNRCAENIFNSKL